MNTCTHGGCTHLHYAKGLCNAHYHRKRRGGDMDAPIREHRLTPEQRFWSKVDKSGDCWPWTASKHPDGYGQFILGGRLQYAHRVSWEWANGPIPDGMEVDHLCWDRACVNPGHLRVVTHAQNLQNRPGAYSNSKTGVRGVTWDKRKGKWLAQARLNGKTHFLGLYEDMEGAGRVVTEWRREHMPCSIMDQERKGAA